MKLINDFFEVIALTPSEGELRCKVKFNPEHFIYKAHFPGNPEAPPIFAVRQSYHKAAKPKIPLTKNLTLYLLYLYDNQLINLIVCSRKSKPFPKVFMIDNR